MVQFLSNYQSLVSSPLSNFSTELGNHIVQISPSQGKSVIRKAGLGWTQYNSL